LIAEACAIAEQYNASVKADRLKTKEFAPAHARLFRRRASIYARRENWAQALDETIKAKGVLQPFIEEPLSKLTREPGGANLTSAQETEILGVLGHYALLNGDQGDYETVTEKYENAEKSFLEALDVAILLSTIELSADGKLQTVNNLRKLHRLALITKDDTKADKYYQQVKESISKFIMDQPGLEKSLFFIECDRARGVAKTNLEEAKKALEKAKQSHEKLIIKGDPAQMEVEYYLVAATTAITRAIDGNSSELPSLEAQKVNLLNKTEKLDAGTLKIRELNYLP